MGGRVLRLLGALLVAAGRSDSTFLTRCFSFVPGLASAQSYERGLYRTRLHSAKSPVEPLLQPLSWRCHAYIFEKSQSIWASSLDGISYFVVCLV